MKYHTIQKEDLEVFNIITKEQKRQKTGLELIPSENYVSEAVLESIGSIMTNKYSEGYPKKRYYGGNTYADAIEILAQNRARALFGVPHANVQPYSGSPANMAVYFALCKPGDIVIGEDLLAGGHLTHGWKVSITGTYYESHQYHVKDDGELDYDEIETLVKKYKPKLLWVGATAHSRFFDYKRLRKIADLSNTYLVADIAHIAGLIVGGVHPSPVPFAHVITTTTHKTLRGPRSGMIMVTQTGLDKDPDLDKKIDRAVFPGLQGGPHDHTTAGIAVALKEADTPMFKAYAKQIVLNAYTLAEALKAEGFAVVGGGTQNHQMRIDLRGDDINGWYFEKALEKANITVNKNTVPQDTNVPYYPSGIRLGTPAVTTRGMKEIHMKQIAHFIAQTRDIIKKNYSYVHEHLTKEHIEQRKRFIQEIKNDADLLAIQKEVSSFASVFPVPGIDD